MASTFDPYDRIYEQVAICKCCHAHPAIKPLLPEGFKYRWEPWRVGKPPFTFIFVAMEPTSEYDPSDVYPQPGAFNEPVRFAIDHFSFKPGEPVNYLVTNMAKCLMKTGSKCDNTREFRYENCAPFLRSEMENASPAFRVISIGKPPKQFLEDHRGLYGPVINGKRIEWILHYGFFNTRRFQEFARENKSSYDNFRDKYLAEYEEFLRRDKGPVRAEQFHQQPDYDLSRIFKYSQQMKDIIASPNCS